MTEEEWLTSTDSWSMLEYMEDRATDRKLRLYLCARAREVWHLVKDERSRSAVRTAERFADGHVSRTDLIRAFNAAHEVWQRIPVHFCGRHGKRDKAAKGARATKEAAAVIRNAANPILSHRPAKWVGWRVNGAKGVAQSGLLRDLFGNPHRPQPFLDPSWLAWRDSIVVGIATTVYDERRFEDLLILADALEDAGCDNADILAHCRGPGPHVRGCWVVDLILGKL